MPSLNIGFMEKNDIQRFTENLQNAEPDETGIFMSQFARGNRAVWHRFIVGSYNHPVTWWIGILQLQMQMGIWGYHRKAVASARSNTLWQVTQPLRDELENVLKGEPAPLLSGIVKYNLLYRKADIAGRLMGGVFTNYASTGGRFGTRRLSPSGKTTRRVANSSIAAYGASIMAIAKSYRSAETVVQSILTGRPEQLPGDYRDNAAKPLTDEESQLLGDFGFVFSEVMSLTRFAPDPVPIEEFCLRPENISLKGVCR